MSPKFEVMILVLLRIDARKLIMNDRGYTSNGNRKMKQNIFHIDMPHYGRHCCMLYTKMRGGMGH